VLLAGRVPVAAGTDGSANELGCDYGLVVSAIVMEA
jgi:hypothetical protein